MADEPTAALFASISTTAELRAATSDEAWVAAVLDFESALALAGADAGVVPAEHARAIADACARAVLDPAEVARGARLAGTPVPPILRALGDAAGDAAARYVHLGATSQDALDTAAMLVSRRALVLVLAHLDRACDACAALVSAHGDTLMTARTLLQPALPTTFALKAAGWLDALLDARGELARVRDERLAVQLGGAAGTLASLGPAGPEVTSHLARRLDLREPRLPWHTARARVAGLAAALAIASGVAAKIALDVTLLMQAEVAEAFEPALEGRGGSSTLPHKRNPVGGAAVAAANRRAGALAGLLVGNLAHEHERSVGAWQAEWETLGELLQCSGGALARVAETLEDLEVDAARMRANLDAAGGLLLGERVALQLAPSLGRIAAHELVERASRGALATRTPLGDALRQEPAAVAGLGSTTLDELLDPASYLGSAGLFVERALACYRETRAAREAPATTAEGGR